MRKNQNQKKKVKMKFIDSFRFLYENLRQSFVDGIYENKC